MVAHAVTVLLHPNPFARSPPPLGSDDLDVWVGNLAHCGLISVGPVAPLIFRTFYTYSHTVGLSSPFSFFSTTHI
jgi:hypothetical protein